ncbi:MAG: thioesterase [Anaerolinea sp.]|nr:thioesterase [Anaerolinea sp.]
MNSSILNNPWCTYVKENKHAKVKLFCFHHAGGRAMLFRDWQTMSRPEIQIIPVELPGRGSRLREDFFVQLQPLVSQLADTLQPFNDKPFAFFGHSMGALISFELARYLRYKNRNMPAHIFISAHRAPHLPQTHEPYYKLPENIFLKKLQEISGTPSEVLDNPEFLELLLPIIRADFEICDTYHYHQERPLNCPITVFGGKQDPVVSASLLPQWEIHTANKFEFYAFHGHHFYIHQAQQLIVEIIGHKLKKCWSDEIGPKSEYGRKCATLES